MPNVLIRDVLPDDLDEIRSAAARSGSSLQNYLRDAVHAQATYLRRQAALARTADRLAGRPAVTEKERQAVLDAVDAADEERAVDLLHRPSRDR